MKKSRAAQEAEAAVAAAAAEAGQGGDTAAATLAAAEELEVRCIVDCSVGRCNDVVTILRAQLPDLTGEVDPDDAAVAYAQTLVQNGGTEA